MKDFGRRALWEGLVAGAIGYAVVALFFVVVNVMQGWRAFHTAEALGLALFYGGVPAAGAGHAGPVIAYNGFHLVLFLVLGMGAAWLAETDRCDPGAGRAIARGENRKAGSRSRAQRRQQADRRGESAEERG